MSTQYKSPFFLSYHFLAHRLCRRAWLMLLLSIALLPLHLSAQYNTAPLNPVEYNSADLENLYQTCQQAREDTVNRICLGFLGSHHLRKNAAAFNGFCTAFKNLCLQKNNRLLYRRVTVIELQNKLRLDSADVGRVSREFEALHNQFVDAGDYSAALECLFELGKFPYAKKNNLQGIKVLFFAEKFAEKYKLQQKISYQGILHYLGYNLWELDKPSASIGYFKRSLATGYVIPLDSMVALNGLGMNYQKLDSLTQSLQYFNEAGKVALYNNNGVFNTVVLGSTAVTLLKLGEVNKAYDYSMQYKNLSIQYPLWENAVDAFYRLTQIELMRNNMGHAKILLDSLDGIMGKISSTDFVSLKRHKEATWQYYEKQQQFDKALAAYKQYVRYDSLFQEYANKGKISEMELNAEVRLYEQEMAAKERARNMRNLLEMAIAAIVLIGIILLAVWGYRKIKLAQKQKMETARINQYQAIEIETLKQQLLNQLAAIRTHNTNYQALITQGSGEVISIEEHDTEDGTATPHSNAMEGNNGMGHPSGDIPLLKAFDLTQKEQWKDFKNSFGKMYPVFEQNITAKMGPVSGAELRLMMLHQLGLSNKEIAQTLLISADGVKKGKYRLYKRLGINTAEELSAFLHGCV